MELQFNTSAVAIAASGAAAAYSHPVTILAYATPTTPWTVMRSMHATSRPTEFERSFA